MTASIISLERLQSVYQFIFLLLLITEDASSRNSGNNGQIDTSIYGMNMQRDWLSDSSSIAMKYEGCVWSYVEDDDGDMGCMEDESEDGTTSWYMMANCKRAQVAYSMYATSSGSTSCSKNNFKETVSPILFFSLMETVFDFHMSLIHS